MGDGGWGLIIAYCWVMGGNCWVLMKCIEQDGRWVIDVYCWVLMKCLEDDEHRVMGDECWVLMECLELDEVIEGINNQCRLFMVNKDAKQNYYSSTPNIQHLTPYSSTPNIQHLTPYTSTPNTHHSPPKPPNSQIVNWHVHAR